MNRMSWFDWSVVIFCWTLPFVLHAIRRWRVRVYFTHDKNLTPAGCRFVREGVLPASASTPASLSAGSAKDSLRRAPSMTCEDFSGEDNPTGAVKPRLVVIERPRPYLVERRDWVRRP